MDAAGAARGGGSPVLALGGAGAAAGAVAAWSAILTGLWMEKNRERIGGMARREGRRWMVRAVVEGAVSSSNCCRLKVGNRTRAKGINKT